MRARAISAVAALAVLLASAGCGGDDDGGGGSTYTAARATPGQGTVLAVEAREMAFSPAPMSAVAGPVTFRLTNIGVVRHDLRLAEVPNVLVEAVPKQTAEGAWVLQPGIYAVYCSIPGHRAAGMATTLTVTKPGS